MRQSSDLSLVARDVRADLGLPSTLSGTRSGEHSSGLLLRFRQRDAVSR